MFYNFLKLKKFHNFIHSSSHNYELIEIGSMKLIYGKDESFVTDIVSTLNTAAECNFEFVIIPLYHSRYVRHDVLQISSTRIGPGTRSDMTLRSNEWISNVVGKISSHIDLENRCSMITGTSEIVFKEELSLACHLGLQAIMLPSLKPHHCINFARIIHQCMLQYSIQNYWIPITLSASLNVDLWNNWSQLSRICGYHHKLSIAIKISSKFSDLSELKLSRWISEPIRAIIIPTKLFYLDVNGLPCLRKKYNQILIFLFEKMSKMHIIFSGNASNTSQYYHYIKYIQILSESTRLTNSSYEYNFVRPYQDILQCPLQPLKDNLESQTYEVFESDPVKYNLYEAAIIRSLEYFSSLGLSKIVIMIVGAGRGPIVSCALSALSKFPLLDYFIYAVEKNKSAIITLRNRQISQEWDNVSIISQDMRNWKPPELVDLIVSELLGSFGDNELSPECLDGIQTSLKSSGIMIPKNYESYIAPMASQRLWMGAKDIGADKYNPFCGLDSPYVVKLSCCNVLASTQKLFEFSHPNSMISTAMANCRYKELTFQILDESTVHGFAGYFKCELFDNIVLSIEPDSLTTGLFSWFPFFIPLRDPIHLTKDSILVLHFWR